jgi:hypothetical protein
VTPAGLIAPAQVDASPGEGRVGRMLRHPKERQEVSFGRRSITCSANRRSRGAFDGGPRVFGSVSRIEL